MPEVAVTETEYRSLLLEELRQTEDSAVARQWGALWRMQGALSGGNTYLRYLRVKRAAIDFLLSEKHAKVDSKEGDASESFGQIFEHLLDLAKATDTAIALAVKAGAGRRAPVVGQLSRTAPRMPTDQPPSNFPLDANDPAYRGDPYRRSK